MGNQGNAPDPEVRKALEDLQSYLSDSTPPLFFASSVQVLFKAPLELVGAQVVAWASAQQSPGTPLPTAAYIFHAAKKIQILSELELLPSDVIKGFLTRLRPALLAGCPESERYGLKEDLELLESDVAAVPTAGVDLVYRRASAEASDGSKARSRERDSQTDRRLPRNFEEGLERLDYLLRRITVTSPAATERPLHQEVRQTVAATAVSEATGGLESAREMDRFLAGLKDRGLPSTPEGLLRMLAKNLPDWAPPAGEQMESTEPPQAAVRAMRKFVSLAENKEDSKKRFEELVKTAVGEFNGGSLGRAVTLLDLAGSMVAKKEVDSTFTDSVRRRAHSKLDMGTLRTLMESEEKRHLLRRVLQFFHEFEPAQLLLELEEEESRDRRRFLLDLLKIHGAEARRAALEELAQAAAGSTDFPWYFKRNLVYLLRNIPRDAEDPIEPEIDILIGLVHPEDSLPLLRETLGALGRLRHERAVTALAARISEIEEALTGERETQHEPDQLRALLDSSVKALVRIGSSEARRVVVAHALTRKPQLGQTLERLVWLSDQDMSKEGDLVDRILREIEAELPKRLFGVALKTARKEYAIDSLIRALAGTDTPAVREMLKRIEADFSSYSFAASGRRILKKFLSPRDEAKGPEATLSGDLGLFSFPNLLQNLADSQVGGALSIYDKGGELTARIWLEKGKVQGAQSGRLTGEVAVLQLLEDPAPGRFELFAPDAPIPHEARAAKSLSIQSILFEGIRRYDEFRRAASIVPDDSRCQPAGSQPTLPEGETDAVLFKEVWSRATAGQSPKECENDLPVDRFRVRRLFEHWLAEGALVFAAASPSA